MATGQCAPCKHHPQRMAKIKLQDLGPEETEIAKPRNELTRRRVAKDSSFTPSERISVL